jgi:hypothetical protein
LLEGDCCRFFFFSEGRLLKGKELLKENCQRGTAKEGLIELVGSFRGNCL